MSYCGLHASQATGAGFDPDPNQDGDVLKKKKRGKADKEASAKKLARKADLAFFARGFAAQKEEGPGQKNRFEV